MLNQRTVPWFTGGAGTDNYCGEDTIFLNQLVRNKISLFLSPLSIAFAKQERSSWFEGQNEKRFMIAGKVLATLYPKTAKLLAIRSAYRFSKRKDVTMHLIRILTSYYKGIDCE